MKKLALALLVGALAAPVFGQSLLVGWNFNNSVAGTGGAPGSFNSTGTSEVYNASTSTLAPAANGALASSASINFSNLAGTMGSSPANNNWGDFAGTTVNAVSGDVAGGALAIIGSGQNTRHVDFDFSSAGYSSLSVSYATQRTGTGFNSQAWSYSLDGGSTFNPLATFSGSAIPSSFGVETFSLVPALDNQASAILRLTVDGASSTSGNNRIDNLTIAAIPEPSVYAGAIGMIAFSFAAWRRRRIASVA